MPPDQHRRLALYYFCYYAALGAYTPYIGRWVDALGHGGYVVGGMLGIWYGSRIVGPPLWAALVARSAWPGRWFVAGCALTTVCFGGFALIGSALANTAFVLLAVMTAFGLFYNAVMPQFEAMTLTALGTNAHDYGRIRVWGSIGFLLVAGSYGALLDHIGDAAFAWLTLPWLLAMTLAAWPYRHDRPAMPAASASDAGHLWKRPGVRRFLLMAGLMQLGFGPFYVFYTLHLQAHGHSGAAIGVLWAVGVAIEIVMFWQAPKLIARHGADRLLMLSLAVTVARWVVTALFADSFTIMLLTQTTHALSFATFHACCMRKMADLFPGRRQAAGQSLLYGFSSGGGGVIGAGIAAVMWEWRGGEAAFLAGAGAALIAWILFALRRRPDAAPA